MSAYGTITVASRPVDLLPPTSWDLPQPAAPGKPAAPFRRLVLHHLRLDSARALPGPSLLDYTHRIFAAEIEAGRTYPQEAVAGSGLIGEQPDNDGGGDADTDMDTDTHAAAQTYTRAAFEAYFWAADVIVAIGQTDDGAAEGEGVEASRAGRRWEDALVGFYYVKPNYPGRSSHVRSLCHFYIRRSSVTRWAGLIAQQCLILAMLMCLQICNAGFIIPPAHREFGYGKTLGKSYLHYGPSLGYKASVFNLVYANNTGSLRYVRATLYQDDRSAKASPRIWDSLGFTRVGLIPRAGRLRRANGNGEEWVDSIIYYQSFVDEEEWARPIDG
jgi:hypothetical protein